MLGTVLNFIVEESVPHREENMEIYRPLVSSPSIQDQNGFYLNSQYN